MCEDQAFKRAKVEHHQAQYMRSMQMVVSYSIRVCAWLRIFEPEEYLGLLRKRLKDYSDEKGRDFKTLVAERVCKIEGGS